MSKTIPTMICPPTNTYTAIDRLTSKREKKKSAKKRNERDFLERGPVLTRLSSLEKGTRRTLKGESAPLTYAVTVRRLKSRALKTPINTSTAAKRTISEIEGIMA